jgi:hypothetical protein
MIMMNKLEKRFSKVFGKVENAAVIGAGAGYMPLILSIFKNVFVFGTAPPEVKSKKLIYRENFDNLNTLTGVSVIFIDLDQIAHLDITAQLWARSKAMVAVEGSDPIGREVSGPLYKNRYRCKSLHDGFHIWKLEE